MSTGWRWFTHSTASCEWMVDSGKEPTEVHHFRLTSKIRHYSRIAKLNPDELRVMTDDSVLKTFTSLYAAFSLDDSGKKTEAYKAAYVEP